MQVTVHLQAGKRERQESRGSYFLILDDAGTGAVVDTTFRHNTQVIEEIRTAKRGTKARMAHGQFTAVEMVADRDCVLEVIISDGAVDIDMFAGANVNATIVGTPVPVSNDRGSAANPVFINGAFAGRTPAAALVDDAPAAIGAALSAIVAANPNRIRLVFNNTGANPVALGGAGITWAHGSMVLQPGDIWVEDTAPNLAWYGICDVALASTIAVQEVTT